MSAAFHLGVLAVSVYTLLTISSFEKMFAQKLNAEAKHSV